MLEPRAEIANDFGLFIQIQTDAVPVFEAALKESGLCV